MKAGWPKGWAVFNMAKDVWSTGEGGSKEWCEPVSDEEYGKLKF